MMHPFGRLDRYVFREFAKIFVATALGLPILVFVSTIVQDLDKYIARKLPIADVALAYVYWIPETMFSVLPAAVLFAAVFTIGAITRYSEITAAKASGISFHRLLAPIVFGALVATGIGLGLGAISPRWNAKRAVLLKETRGGTGGERPRFAYTSVTGRVYRIAHLNVDSAKVTSVEVERPGKGRDYPTQLIAAAGGHWEARGGWTLRSGTVHLLAADTSDEAFAFDSLVDRRMGERPRELMLAAKTPDDMTYRELGRYIRAQERSGTDVKALRVARMLRIAIPATCLIIVFLGAPLATSTQRGGTAFGIGMSLGVTIIFLILVQLTKAIGATGLVNPELAAWIPSALFGGVGVVMLRRTRT